MVKNKSTTRCNKKMYRICYVKERKGLNNIDVIIHKSGCNNPIGTK